MSRNSDAGTDPDGLSRVGDWRDHQSELNWKIGCGMRQSFEASFGLPGDSQVCISPYLIQGLIYARPQLVLDRRVS